MLCHGVVKKKQLAENIQVEIPINAEEVRDLCIADGMKHQNVLQLNKSIMPDFDYNHMFVGQIQKLWLEQHPDNYQMRTTFRLVLSEKDGRSSLANNMQGYYQRVASVKTNFWYWDIPPLVVFMRLRNEMHGMNTVRRRSTENTLNLYPHLVYTSDVELNEQKFKLFTRGASYLRSLDQPPKVEFNIILPPFTGLRLKHGLLWKCLIGSLFSDEDGQTLKEQSEEMYPVEFPNPPLRVLSRQSYRRVLGDAICQALWPELFLQDEIQRDLLPMQDEDNPPGMVIPEIITPIQREYEDSIPTDYYVAAMNASFREKVLLGPKFMEEHADLLTSLQRIIVQHLDWVRRNTGLFIALVREMLDVQQQSQLSYEVFRIYTGPVISPKVTVRWSFLQGTQGLAKQLNEVVGEAALNYFNLPNQYIVFESRKEHSELIWRSNPTIIIRPPGLDDQAIPKYFVRIVNVDADTNVRLPNLNESQFPITLSYDPASPGAELAVGFAKEQLIQEYVGTSVLNSEMPDPDLLKDFAPFTIFLHNFESEQFVFNSRSKHWQFAASNLVKATGKCTGQDFYIDNLPAVLTLSLRTLNGNPIVFKNSQYVHFSVIIETELKE